MMTTFRCKRSGNTVNFTNEDDIKQIRSHEEYEEVKNDTEKDTSKSNDEVTKEGIVDRPSEGKVGDEANEGNDGQDGQYEGQKRSVLKKRGRPVKK